MRFVQSDLQHKDLSSNKWSDVRPPLPTSCCQRSASSVRALPHSKNSAHMFLWTAARPVLGSLSPSAQTQVADRRQCSSRSRGRSCGPAAEAAAGHRGARRDGAELSSLPSALCDAFYLAPNAPHLRRVGRCTPIAVTESAWKLARGLLLLPEKVGGLAFVDSLCPLRSALRPLNAMFRARQHHAQLLS